jgi:FG-GAP-like repeat
MTQRHNITVALALISVVFFPVGAVAQAPLRIAGPAQFPLGASPNALTHGDFNGDGFEDVASANSGFPNNTVSALINDGDGSFGGPILTTLSDFPVDIASTDFNRDGRDDLVVSELGSIQLLLSNGNGTFAESNASTVANASVAAGDFNGDGNPDFAAGYYSFPNGHVQVYFGRGDGTFNLPVAVAQGSWDMDGLLAADLEGDGDIDLAFFDFSFVWAQLNSGAGTFGAPVQSTNAGGTDVALGDFNGDGNLDATSVDASGGNVSVALGDGAGHFMPEADYPVIDTQGLSVTTGDFNGDGRLDIAAGDDNDAGVVLRGRGDGRFAVLAKYLTGGYDLMAVDVNGDTRPDLLGHSLVPNELSVSYASARGLGAPAIHTFASFNDFIELADVNGDGRLDAVGSGFFSSGLEVLLNRGKGRMSPPIVSSTTHQPRAVALGDLNGDGRVDAVIGSVPIGGVPNLEIFLGDGAGRFTHTADLNNGSAAAIFGEALELADMNLDGNLDIVSNTFTAISVLPGNGNGTFGSAIISGAGNGSSSVLKVRDFDNDGIPDVVTVADTLNNDDAESIVYLNLGVGNGNLTFQQSFTIDARTPAGDSADLNGDGLPDLAITGNPGTHSGRGGMFVALNMGGSFGLVVHYDAATGSLALGDLNGDARPEAVLTNLSDVEVWTNNGDGTFGQQPLVLPAPDSSYEVELGNLLGSPRLDLAVLGSGINPSKLVLYQNLAR